MARVRSEDLPTTPQIAVQGVEAFTLIANVLPPGRIRSMFLKDRSLRMCFVGTMPEMTLIPGNYAPQGPLSSLNFQETISLAHTIATVTPDVGAISLVFDRRLLGEPDDEFSSLTPPPGLPLPPPYAFHFVNTLAATRVVVNNPGFFPPESRQNTKPWIMDNSDTWGTSDEMYGLLSGIPAWAAQSYASVYASIIKGERWDYSRLSEEEYASYAYATGKTPNDPKRGEIMSVLLRKMIPDLTGVELQILMSMHFVRTGRGTPGFIGFDPARDRQYTKMLRAVYRESGIESQATELAKKTEKLI